MASYARFLGREITVSYRVGEITLKASGIFVGDSGRSIFLEQHLEQHGRRNYFRWEIPYQYIQSIVEEDESAAEVELPISGSNPETQGSGTEHARRHPASMAASASAGSTGILPLARRPKTA